MDVGIDTMVNLLGLFLGTGGGAFFTWRFMRRKAKAEAVSAEVDAARDMQGMYQKMLEDANAYLDDARQKVSGLRDERDHYKKDRDELREQVGKLQTSIFEWKQLAEDDRSEMKRTISRLGRKVDAMTPFICARQGCPDRIAAVVSDDGDVKPRRQHRKAAEASTSAASAAVPSVAVPQQPQVIDPINEDI